MQAHIVRLLLGQLGRNGRRNLRCRSVSTDSSLLNAFDTKPTRKLNFSLTKSNVGLFSIPQLRDFTGFYLLKEECEDDVHRLLSEALSPNRKRKIVQICDEISDCICRVADMSYFVHSAHTHKSYQDAAFDVYSSLNGLVEELNVNVDLYNVLKKVARDGDVLPTDCVDERVTRLFMQDFEQSGIHLEESKRQKFVALNENILNISSFFMQNTHTAVSVSKNILPEHLRHCFNVDGDNIVVNSLFADSHNEYVREAAYKIYLRPTDHQERLLTSLLTARNQMANLVGFPTHAHRVLQNTLMSSPENVVGFLDNLSSKLEGYAQKDFDMIKQLKLKSSHTNSEVMPWDPPYYSAIARHQKCAMDGAELAPYFSLGNCMEGLQGVLKSLFGVTLEYETPAHGEVWHYDVHKLAVVHETEGVLGYIYCDLFERRGKAFQDCQHTITGGRERADGSYQLPVVVLMLNFMPPQNSRPSFLTQGQLSNLFHEFGHAVHYMLGRTKYQHVTGARCSLDFAEIPSNLMEFFLQDPKVLSTFAKHYKTGEPLPEHILKNVAESRNVCAASELQLQLLYSMADQVFHGQTFEKSTTEVYADLYKKYYGLPYVANTAFQLRFGHLVNYNARYYGYIVAKALAALIWQECFKDNPFNRQMGEKLRRELLAHGGGIPPRELVKNMLGEEPSNDMMVQSLIDSLTQP